MERIEFEFATQDDCLDRMVPSDLRVLVAQRDNAETTVSRLNGLLVECLTKLEVSAVPPVNLIKRIRLELGATLVRGQRPSVEAEKRFLRQLPKEMAAEETET